MILKQYSHADRKTLFRELSYLERLKSEFIVEVKCFFEDNNGFYLVLHRYPSTLTEWLKVPREDREVLRTVYHCLRAAAYLAERGVIHSDIKPDNILIDETGKADRAGGSCRSIRCSG